MAGPKAELLGEVYTNALPAEDPVLYGSATLSPEGAFDVWLDESEATQIHLETNHFDASIPLRELGREDRVFPAGGLDLELRLFRLPDRLQDGPMQASVEIPLHDRGDNPLWVRVTTEDGFQAWTSPVYLFS